MNWNRAISVLLPAVLAAVLWVFLAGQFGDEAADLEHDIRVQPRNGDDQLDGLRPGLVTELPGTLQAQQAHSEVDEALVFESTDDLDDTNSIPVLAVHADSGRPVAGGVLLVARTRERIQEVEAFLRRNPLAMIARSQAPLYRIARDGRVRIPVVPPESVLIARSGSSMGVLKLGYQRQDVARVVVSPLRNAQVRVCDDQGQGIPGVVVEIGYRRDRNPFRGRPFKVLAQARTDQQGHASVPFSFSLWPESRRNPGTVSITVGGFHNAAPLVDVDKERLHEEPVVLVLPRHGFIDLRILDPRGNLFTGGGDLRVGVIPEDADPAPAAEDVESRIVFDDRIPAGGFPVIVPAAPGQRLHFMFDPVESKFAGPVRLITSGPARSGETRTVALQLEVPGFVLVGRAVDEAGAPLRSTRITVGVARQTRHAISMRAVDLRTDHDGRFHLARLDQLLPEEGVRYLARLERRTRGLPRLWCEVELSTDVLGTIPVDLGDVVLRADRVLAAGRIVNQDGQPLSGLGASLSLLREDRDKGVQLEGITATRSDWTGHFMIFGETDASELRLHISGSGIQTQRRTIIRGERNIHVTVEQLGGLKGRLIPSDPMRPQDVMVRLKKKGDGTIWTTNPDDDGSFAVDQLAPGIYDILVTPRGSRDCILEGLGAHEVRPGSMTDTGEHILGCEVFSYEVTLLEPPQLSEKRFLKIKATDSQTGELIYRSIFYSSPALLGLAAKSCDLRFHVEGYRDLEQENVSPGPLEVRLKKGLPVKVTIVNQEIVPEGLSVEVALRFAGSRSFAIDLTTDDDGLFHVSQPGPYKVSVRLVRRKRSGVFKTGVTKTPGVVTVQNVEGVQSFSVTLDRESCQRRADSLR